MKRIPVTASSEPIACTIGHAEIPARVQLLDRMRSSVRTVERTTDGMLLRFPHRPDIEADVHRFAVDEKRCCSFWDFAVDNDDEGLVLRWDGPPSAAELMAHLVAYFEGDEPLLDISGLLWPALPLRPSPVHPAPAARP